MKTPDLIEWLKQHIAYTDEEGDRGYKLNVSLAAARLQALDARVAELTQALEFVAEFIRVDDIGDESTVMGAVVDEEGLSIALSFGPEVEALGGRRYSPLLVDSWKLKPFDLILKAAKAHAGTVPSK